MWDAMKVSSKNADLARAAKRLDQAGQSSVAGRITAAVASNRLLKSVRSAVSRPKSGAPAMPQVVDFDAATTTQPVVHRNKLLDMYAGKKSALKKGAGKQRPKTGRSSTPDMAVAAATGSTSDSDADGSSSSTAAAPSHLSRSGRAAIVARAGGRVMKAVRAKKLRNFGAKLNKVAMAARAVNAVTRTKEKPLDVWVEWHRRNAPEVSLLPETHGLCACIEPFPGSTYTSAKQCARGRAQWRLFEARNRAVTTLCALSMFMYLPVSTRILSFFLCQEVADAHYLVVDRSTQCYTAEWWQFFPFALAGVVAFVVGVPVGSMVILNRARSSHVAQYISLVLQPYDPAVVVGTGLPRLKCGGRVLMRLPSCCHWGRTAKSQKVALQMWQWRRACERVGAPLGDNVVPGHPLYDKVQVRASCGWWWWWSWWWWWWCVRVCERSPDRAPCVMNSPCTHPWVGTSFKTRHAWRRRMSVGWVSSPPRTVWSSSPSTCAFTTSVLAPQLSSSRPAVVFWCVCASTGGASTCARITCAGDSEHCMSGSWSEYGGSSQFDLQVCAVGTCNAF